MHTDDEILRDIAERINNYGSTTHTAEVCDHDGHDFIDVACPSRRSLRKGEENRATFPSAVAKYALEEHGMIRTKAIAFGPESKNAIEDSLTLRVWFNHVDLSV